MNNSESNPESQNALREAMSCHQQGQYYDADLHYRRAIELDPDNAQALRLRAILQRETGNPAIALQLLDQAEACAPDYAEPVAEKAMTLMMCGELELADAEFRRALQRAPNAIHVLVNFGALLQHRGHVAEAVEQYRAVLAQDEEEIEVRCNLALALADLGDFTAAIDAARQAVALAEGQRGGLATLGSVLLDAGKDDEAETSLLRAEAIEDSDSMVLVNLALCAMRRGENDTATSYLETAVQAHPHNARAVADLINAYSANDQHDMALGLANGFLDAHPGERLVIANYAQALLNAGETESALSLTDTDTFVRVYDVDAPVSGAELTQLILGDSSLMADPTSKSTTGGAQTGELNMRTAPWLALSETFDTAIRDAADYFIKQGFADHPVMQPAANDWALRAWGTVIDAGGYQESHMHPLGWLSGVYYAALPDNMAGTGHDGWLEFGTPPPRIAQKEKPATRRVEPREGRLVIFPSWFWHRTLPFAKETTSGSRISIAFDVMPLNMMRRI